MKLDRARTEYPLCCAGFSLLRSTGTDSPYPEQAAALRARGYVVDLQPGEALYLPSRWLHEVESAADDGGGGHMSVNFWWIDGRAE